MNETLGFVSTSYVATINSKDRQLQRLIDFGIPIEKIIIETPDVNGDINLAEYFDRLFEGDRLVVTSLDHLGNTVESCVLLILSLVNSGIDLVVVPIANNRHFSNRKLRYAIALLEKTSLSYHQVGLLLNVSPHSLYRFVSPSGELRDRAVRRLRKHNPQNA